MNKLVAGMLVLGLAGGALAVDTFTATIVLPSGNAVSPGVPLPIEVHGVLTNNAPGNDGLCFFSVDFSMSGPDAVGLGAALLLTEPGDGTMDNFVRDAGYDAGYGGTPVANDLVQAGGAQNTIGNNPAMAPMLPFPAAAMISLNVGHADQVVLVGTITFPEGTTEGTYTLGLDNVLANVISDGSTPGPFAVYPVDAGNGVAGPDVTIEVSDCAAPLVVAAAANDGVSFEARAFSGYIDPRLESNNGINLNRGIMSVVMVFNTPVEDLAGGALTAAAFSVAETGGGAAPTITGIDTDDDLAVTINFNRPLTLRQWTTVRASVKSQCNGTIIADNGNQGPGVVEPDRIDIAFLPGDTDQNAMVQPLDLLRFRQYVSAVGSCACAACPPATHTALDFGAACNYFDIDRNNSIQPLDLLRLRQLLLGTSPATQVWASVGLLNTQP